MEIEKPLTIDEERKAERILLKKLIDMPQEKRIPYLQSLGISYDEFEHLWEKHYHIIKKYIKIKGKTNVNSNTASCR